MYGIISAVDGMFDVVIPHSVPVIAVYVVERRFVFVRYSLSVAPSSSSFVVEIVLSTFLSASRSSGL